jgi:uncharacterized membrane-anchored protein YjiN (DUF445 family)
MKWYEYISNSMGLLWDNVKGLGENLYDSIRDGNFNDFSDKTVAQYIISMKNNLPDQYQSTFLSKFKDCPRNSGDGKRWTEYLTKYAPVVYVDVKSIWDEIDRLKNIEMGNEYLRRIEKTISDFKNGIHPIDPNIQRQNKLDKIKKYSKK